MLTLTVADNANNTGATATISGSSGGSVSVYTQNVDGELAAGTWASAGTRTGNGTLALSLAKGYYFTYALEGASLSGLVYFQVTDGLDAVISRVFAAAKSRIQLLNLPCTQHVYDSQYANSPIIEYPCVVLSTEGMRFTDEAALNNTDYIGNPVRCQIKDVCIKFDDAKRDTYRAWAQAIRRAFINQRIPGVAESIRNKVEFGDVAAVESNFAQVVAELTIRPITRELRGLGA